MPVGKSRKKKGKKTARGSGQSSSPRSAIRTFHVACLIAGPKLPEAGLSFGPHEIRRVPAVDVDQIDQTVPDVMMEIRNEPHVVSVFPGYSQVKTEWMMTLRVDAEDPKRRRRTLSESCCRKCSAS
jgi:hypothetical protein